MVTDIEIVAYADLYASDGSSSRPSILEYYPEIIYPYSSGGVTGTRYTYYKYGSLQSDIFDNNTLSVYYQAIVNDLPADWFELFPYDYDIYVVYGADTLGYYTRDRVLYFTSTSTSLDFKRFDTFFEPVADNYPVSDIYFLYDIGNSLLSSDIISAFLGYKIGNTNLVSILFTSGFLLDVSWVVVKWVIPL